MGGKEPDKTVFSLSESALREAFFAAQTPHRAALSASKQLNKPQAPAHIAQGLFRRKKPGYSRRIPGLSFAQSFVFIGGYFEEFPHCFRRPVMALFLLCEIKLYANDVSCKCWRSKRGRKRLLVS